MSTIVGSIGRYFNSDTIKPFFDTVDGQSALAETFDWKTAILTYLADKPQFSQSQKDEISRIHPRKFLRLYMEMHPRPLPDNLAPEVRSAISNQIRHRYIRQ